MHRPCCANQNPGNRQTNTRTNDETLEKQRIGHFCKKAEKEHPQAHHNQSQQRRITKQQRKATCTDQKQRRSRVDKKEFFQIRPCLGLGWNCRTPLPSCLPSCLPALRPPPDPTAITHLPPPPARHHRLPYPGHLAVRSADRPNIE